ncbi:carcinoembryonic antigen-related cell adhesion molecule 5-like isoform X2 [Silurus meridionalis]|uniref:carcinoembryonic antigen-related cell adhesion molecule 5-like isoform X2 n=1 Tax=Silurus meridionalis TaxID=175797 RepID=UPI001EECB555|nr:carcinoembryonic antigen-related cell adhesion molecule 5-like isoform X2 [Silurus meridionalis]
MEQVIMVTLILALITGPETVNPIYSGRVFLNSSSGELELKKLTLADSGEYTLVLTFESGLGFQDNTLLQVFEPVFNISIRGPEGNLIENSSVNFTCEGNGTISTTLWKKGMEILNSSSSITFLDDNRTVVFSPLLRSDSGNYQCVMNNPISNGFAGYNITVNYGPDVRMLGVQTLEEGSDILLFCSSKSFPPATVSWTVKGMSFVNTLLYVKENSNSSDSGNYSCTCMNKVTGITASAFLILTVEVVSSRLGPGVEAGITLGVVIALVLLLMLTFFLVEHFKKPAGPVREAQAPMTGIRTNPTFDDMNAGARTPVTTTGITHNLQANKEKHAKYINTPPSLPPRGPPPLPRDRQTQESDLYSRTIDTFK